MRFIHFILFAVLFFVDRNEAEIKCSKKTERRIDETTAKLLVVGQVNRRFPQNDKELRPYCNEANRIVDVVTEYNNKCLNPNTQKAASLLIFPIKNQLKIICRPGRLSKRARELLKAAPCANGGLQYYQKCNLEVIDAYMGIINAPEKHRIPMGCCQFHKFRECLRQEAADVRECTRANIDYVDRFIGEIFQGILQFLCYDYDESSSKCEKMILETPKRNTSIPRYKSLIPPALNIMESIGDN